MILFKKKRETDRVKLYVDGKKFDNTKFREGEILITRGDTKKMSVINGSVKEATTAGMKIRMAHNKDEDKFFIQLVDRESLRSFRIYLTEDEFQLFLNHGFTVLNLSRKDEEYNNRKEPT